MMVKKEDKMNAADGSKRYRMVENEPAVLSGAGKFDEKSQTRRSILETLVGAFIGFMPMSETIYVEHLRVYSQPFTAHPRIHLVQFRAVHR